jgi:hypothetical protein
VNPSSQAGSISPPSPDSRGNVAEPGADAIHRPKEPFMIKIPRALVVVAALAMATVVPATTASADPIPTGCFQQSVLDSTMCANYSYTGDARYSSYGYRCGHDIEANAQACLDSFDLRPPRDR